MKSHVNTNTFWVVSQGNHSLLVRDVFKNDSKLFNLSKAGLQFYYAEFFHHTLVYKTNENQNYSPTNAALQASATASLLRLHWMWP